MYSHVKQKSQLAYEELKIVFENGYNTMEEIKNKLYKK